MAITITAINGRPNYNQKEFLLTDASQIDLLPRYGIRGTQNDPNNTIVDEPCGYGSSAMVCSGGFTEVYILTPDNEWVLM